VTSSTRLIKKYRVCTTSVTNIKGEEFEIKQHQKVFFRKSSSRHSLVNTYKQPLPKAMVLSGPFGLLIAITLPFLSASVAIRCGSGCSEWMIQDHIIYFIDDLYQSVQYEDDIAAASLDDIFDDTCKLLAIREVLNNSVQRNCRLLQTVTAQIRELCHFVSFQLHFACPCIIYCRFCVPLTTDK